VRDWPTNGVTVLMLVGSPTNDFYRELSELYARGAYAALNGLAAYRFAFAHVDPSGAWRFPAMLDPETIAASPALTLDEAIAEIVRRDIDVALPQMFCQRGVADYRALLDLLGLPYLGNPPLQMAIAADKAMARAIVAAAGVAVPDAQLVRRGETATCRFPVVVKPNTADNSEGIAFVATPEALSGALAHAFDFSDTVLLERYVELGREVRCGVIDDGARLICLPLEEYFVDSTERSVRRRDDKIKRREDGMMMLGAKTRRESWIVAGDDPVVPAVHAAACAAHRAIGFRQYSLFDFRIDPAGRPWFLEASPYCSFAPDSVLVTMMKAHGVPLVDFFTRSVRAAAPRVTQKAMFST
jgi:D-alanine-D-alanine ligase